MGWLTDSKGTNLILGFQLEAVLQRISLSHTHTRSHTQLQAYTHVHTLLNFNLLWLPSSHKSVWLAITVSVSLSCMFLYRRDCLLFFIWGFPLDLLCTPIRFVTQLLWMGLRDRQNWGREVKKGTREEEKNGFAEWGGVGHLHARMYIKALEKKSERKGKSELKILVSSSTGLQLNSWICPGGFGSNMVPLEQSS